MNKTIYLTTICSLLLTISKINAQDYTSYSIPFTGNGFEINPSIESMNSQKEDISLDNKKIKRLYFKLLGSGNIDIKLKGNTKFKTELEVEFNKTHKTIVWKENNTLLNLGSYIVTKPGYYYVELKTKNKNIAFDDIIISGAATDKGIVYSNNPEYFYWARRGPSCHLSYEIPTEKNVSYYYSEIVVPKGQDQIGSYFMANGFAEGYFGMQVNSSTERRILFSVWSPFVTDDPKSIPEEDKIKLLRKGEDVYTGEFGNEGSGGQSFLRYNWKADETYRFLLKGEPDRNGNTIYSAWFYIPETSKWKLIASFKRPKTDTYLKRFHSFLENFDPNQGYFTREAQYNNQWVYDGQWKKVTSAKFTVDATYKANQRVDATGGTTRAGYFLKMGGFFNEITQPNTLFQFNSENIPPQIDLNSLP